MFVTGEFVLQVKECITEVIVVWWQHTVTQGTCQRAGSSWNKPLCRLALVAQQVDIRNVHVHSYFVSTFNYTFCTQPDDISFKSVLGTFSKFCILVGLCQDIIPAWYFEVRHCDYYLSTLLFATSCWFFSVMCLVVCVCSETHRDLFSCYFKVIAVYFILLYCGLLICYCFVTHVCTCTLPTSIGCNIGVLNVTV